MFIYIVRRLIQSIPALIGIAIFSFLLLHLVPGGPAQTLLGQHATPTRIRGWIIPPAQICRALSVCTRGKNGQNFPDPYELGVSSFWRIKVPYRSTVMREKDAKR